MWDIVVSLPALRIARCLLVGSTGVGVDTGMVHSWCELGGFQ